MYGHHHGSISTVDNQFNKDDNVRVYRHKTKMANSRSESIAFDTVRKRAFTVSNPTFHVPTRI